MHARSFGQSIVAATCGLLLAAFDIVAQAPDRPDPRESSTVLRPGAKPVEKRSVSFIAAEQSKAQLDLYYDASVPGTRPTLVLVSGTDDARPWGGYRDFARLAVERGFAAVVPTKRFARGADGVRHGRDDTRELLKRIGALAPDVIDRNRLCVWVFSAGGTTLAGVYGSGAPQVSCVIGYYPMLSLRAAGATDEEWLAAYSPAEVLARHGSAASPPTLIVRAGRDSAAINGGVDLFVAHAMKRNVPITLVNLPAAQHAFDWYDDSDWAREAMEASFDYAKQKTRPRDAARKP